MNLPACCTRTEFHRRVVSRLGFRRLSLHKLRLSSCFAFHYYFKLKIVAKNTAPGTVPSEYVFFSIFGRIGTGVEKKSGLSQVAVFNWAFPRNLFTLG